MDRRFPRIGFLALLVAATQLLALVFNGLLGWFPAGLIGTGDRGMKFHLYTYLRQSLGLPYKSNNFWSEAGVLTGQEYAMLVVLVIFGLIGYIGTRERADFSGPEARSYEDQREMLDSGAVEVARPSGLSVVNPTTAAIVDSVVGKSALPTGEAIENALGSMAEVAATMATDAADSEEIPMLDSRFTVSIDAEVQPQDAGDTLGLEGEESDWVDDWISPSEAEVEPESSGFDEMEEMAVVDLTQEPAAVAETVAEVEPQPRASLPAVPVAEPRSAHRVGAIPVRPHGLPAPAEWDDESQCWVLFGRPIEMAELPSPAAEKPSWAQPESADGLPSVPSPPKRDLPAIPTTSKGVSMPNLPNLPARP